MLLPLHPPIRRAASGIATVIRATSCTLPWFTVLGSCFVPVGRFSMSRAARRTPDFECCTQPVASRGFHTNLEILELA